MTTDAHTTDDLPGPAHAVARSFTSGMSVHAVPRGAQPVGQPRPSRNDGYRVPYRSECGKDVALRRGSPAVDGAENVHSDAWAYRWVAWPPKLGLRCRSCSAAVDRATEAAGEVSS